MDTKQCSQCNTIQDFNNFYKNKMCNDGYNHICIQCYRTNKEIRKTNNKDKVTIKPLYSLKQEKGGTHKICNKCRINKELDEYCKKQKCNDGLNTICKQCTTEYANTKYVCEICGEQKIINSKYRHTLQCRLRQLAKSKNMSMTNLFYELRKSYNQQEEWIKKALKLYGIES